MSVLTEVRKLLSDESRWSKGSYAKDENGVWVDPTSPAAVSFCLLGAISKCQNTSTLPSHDGENVRRILNCLPSDVPQNIPRFNDDYATHEQVLAVLDCAIAKEEAEKPELEA